jgi:hypothetical protein
MRLCEEVRELIMRRNEVVDSHEKCYYGQIDNQSQYVWFVHEKHHYGQSE